MENLDINEMACCARRPRRNRRKKQGRRFFLCTLAVLVIALAVGLVCRVLAEQRTAPTSRIEEIAAGELGSSWEKYCDWWGFDGREEWCAVFVSWCAEQAGYKMDTDYIRSIGMNADLGHPRDTGAGAGCHARFHSKQDRYRERASGYQPKSGDFIYFDWEQNNASEGFLVMDHIGIVEKVSWGRVYTIEGNSTQGEGSADLVRRKSYPLTASSIIGYSDMCGITEKTR